MSHLPRKTQRISASTGGAAGQARRAREVGSVVSGLDKSGRKVAFVSQSIYKQHAPKRSGRLARGIKVTAVGDTAVLTVNAIDPGTGFDYVAVSRLGHRKRYIFPVTKSGQPRKTRRAKRGPGGAFVVRDAGKLVFRSRGKIWRLSGVRGFRPKADWVKTAFPEVKAVADAEMELTGHKITARWGGSG